MLKRLNNKSLEGYRQKKAKLPFQNVEFAQASPECKEDQEKVDQDQKNVSGFDDGLEAGQEARQNHAKTPTCWSELPEKVWLRVLQNLKLKDINKLHLVCSNLHQITNLHVNPKLHCRGTPKQLQSLVQSSRIFEELEFSKFSGDCLTNPRKFQILEEYLEFAGPHIKTLNINEAKFDQKILQKMLNFLPNLKALDLEMVENVTPSEERVNLTLKSTKIERVKIVSAVLDAEFLFESLEKCSIKEARFGCLCEREAGIVQKLVKSQEKNLKKLSMETNYDFDVDLKKMRLEYFHLTGINNEDVKLEFLRDQVELKNLKVIRRWLPAVVFHLFGGMKDLEFLELVTRTDDCSGLNQLHKLRKLKKLQVDEFVCLNLLEHLQLGVFEDLEVLAASFHDAPLESIQDMKRITPNLKDLVIWSYNSDTVNAFLETLDKLESLTASGDYLEIPTTQIYPKIKYLHVFGCFETDPEQLVKTFPNLEILRLDNYLIDLTKSTLIELLSGLKQLKEIYLGAEEDFGFDYKFVVKCFRDYGNLETFQINKFAGTARFVTGFTIWEDPGKYIRVNKRKL